MRRCLVLALIVLSACTPQNEKTTPSLASSAARVGADSVAIRATLDAWYVAMQAVDSAAIVAPLTPQFLLLEDTLPLSGAALVARLKQGGTETKWTAAFSDFRTRIVGDVAWTTVKNHETSTGTDGKHCQADFLETIVFVRDAGRWLIDRYHAAAVQRWSCGT